MRGASLATLRTGNRVLPDTARVCRAPVQQEDLEVILNNLSLGKSPGPDRLELRTMLHGKCCQMAGQAAGEADRIELLHMLDWACWAQHKQRLQRDHSIWVDV